MDETMTWELTVISDTALPVVVAERYPTELAVQVAAREMQTIAGRSKLLFSTRDLSVPEDERPGYRGWKELLPVSKARAKKEGTAPREPFTLIGVCPEEYWPSFEVGQRVRLVKAYRTWMMDDRIFTVEKLLHSKMDVRTWDGKLLRGRPSVFEAVRISHGD